MEAVWRARSGESLLQLQLGHISTIELPAPKGATGADSGGGRGGVTSQSDAGRRTEQPETENLVGREDATTRAKASGPSVESALAATDPCCGFDEVTAAKGCLGRFPGREVTGLLWELAKTHPLLENEP